MATGNPNISFTKVNTSGSSIGPFLAVAQDLANDFGVVVATANQRALGIGPEYATPALQSLPVVFSGEVKALISGTVTRGDRLNVGSTAGQLATITTSGIGRLNIVAIAAQSGTTGQAIDVQVVIYQETAGDYLS